MLTFSGAGGHMSMLTTLLFLLYALETRKLAVRKTYGIGLFDTKNRYLLEETHWQSC